MPIDLFALAALDAADAAASGPLLVPMCSVPLAAALAPLAALGVDTELDPEVMPLGLVVVLEEVCAIAPVANKPARRMLNSLVISKFPLIAGESAARSIPSEVAKRCRTFRPNPRRR
jgi:hypothetical protein